MYVAITTCQSAKSLSRKGTILADESRSKVTVLFVADSDQLDGRFPTLIQRSYHVSRADLPHVAFC